MGNTCPVCCLILTIGCYARFDPSMFKKLALAFTLSLAASTASAQEIDAETEDFVSSNLIAIFYHELGHALIDILQLPVFGQEEDAADVLSVVMVHELFDEETAVAITYATAYGFLGEAEDRESQGADVAWWGVHGADLQRYYTLVCLFYGASPDEREDVAEELGLPEERAITCEDEYQLANDSWGPVLDELYEAGAGDSFVYSDMGDDAPFAVLTHNVIVAELTALNEVLSLPTPLKVSVAYCGEANAFYDPSAVEVTMCIEFAEYLAELSNQ